MGELLDVIYKPNSKQFTSLPPPPPPLSPKPTFLKAQKLSSLRFRHGLLIACIFLSVLALALLSYPIISVNPSLTYPFLVRHNDALEVPVLQFLERRRLNETLLDMAGVDLGESDERKQISNILDGTWQRAAQNRYPFRHDRRDRNDHYSDRFRDRFWDRGRTSRGRDQRLPLQLARPRFLQFWPQFRQSLQSWVQNKRHEPQIMRELLRLVKDPIDRHYMKKTNITVELGKPYKSCAVVGNSGILLNQSYSALIDSHDMVMRLNNARISGFEQYVGSKTTLSFVNSNILNSCARQSTCYCHPYGADVPLIMYICQVVHFMDVAYCSGAHQSPIIVTDARFDTLCARIIKYYSLKGFVESTGKKPEGWAAVHDGPLFHYSSGMQAVMLAVGICNEISLFGFGKSDTAKHHYHTNQKAELRLHDYSAEYQLYMDLASRNSNIVPFLREAGFSIPPVHIYW